MNFTEATVALKAGKRLTAAHLSPGCYVEQDGDRIVRAWPVDRPEDEWQRSQCSFTPAEVDQAADWIEVAVPAVDSEGKPLQRPVVAPEGEAEPGRVRRSRWGKTSEAAQLIAIEQQRARDEEE